MSDMKRREFITREFFARVFDLCTREIGPPVIGSIQNNSDLPQGLAGHSVGG